MKSEEPATVYRPKGWQGVADLFAGMDRNDLPDVKSWLVERSRRVFEQWEQSNPAVTPIVASWHEEWMGKSHEEILGHPPTLGDARHAVAREHGFKEWASVETAKTLFDPEFEGTVDAMLGGRLDVLSDALERDATLATRRSPFAHRATLLHYMAANGVETERQVTPLNAVALVRALLQAGADPLATMPVYGGEFSALQLLTTSAHPAAAGVRDDVASLLSG